MYRIKNTPYNDYRGLPVCNTCGSHYVMTEEEADAYKDIREALMIAVPYVQKELLITGNPNTEIALLKINKALGKLEKEWLSNE